MDRRKVIFGLLLILVGLLLLGRTTDLFYFTFGDVLRILLPVALILLGAWLIIRRKAREDSLKAHIQHQAWTSGAAGTGTSYTFTTGTGPAADAARAASEETTGRPGVTAEPTARRDGALKYSKFLGDLKVDCNGINLQNVEISTGVGDLEIKLHGGRLEKGLNRMIISGFVGDVRIFAPNDMPHYVHCSSFIGDIDAGGQHAGGLSNTIESQTCDYDTAESKLYIAINSFIGDIKVFVT